MNKSFWQSIFDDLGVLRTLLLLSVACAIAAAPFASGTEEIRGWALVPTVLGPTVMMIVLFVLPLDMMMSAIFMVDTDSAGKRKFKRIILIEMGALLSLLAVWLPFMIRILDMNPFD